MRTTFLVTLSLAIGSFTIQAPAPAHALERAITLHCVMPLTPSQVSQFDVRVDVSVEVAGAPTAGEPFPISARVAWDSVTNPLDQVITIGEFELSMFVEGAGSPLRFTGPAQDLDPGQSTTNPVSEYDNAVMITGAPGAQFRLDVYRFVYSIRINGGGPQVTCLPIGVATIPLFSARIVEPVAHDCKGVPATIVGTNRDDVLVGTDDADVIQAGAGNDVVFGLGGDDRICGSHGRDLLLGGWGADRLYGEGGNDDLRGGQGDDRVHGGGQIDVCSSGIPIRCEVAA